MTQQRLSANLVMRVLGDDIPHPYLIYTLFITEGNCEEKLELGTYQTIRHSTREEYTDHANNQTRPIRTLYNSLKDALPLSISLSGQPLIQAFSQAPLEIGRENRTLHPLDELCVLQAAVHEISMRDCEFFQHGKWPLLWRLGNQPIDPRTYQFLRKAYREILPTGNIYKPASLNPRHGEKEKGRRSAPERKRPA